MKKIEHIINHQIALEDSHPRCEKPKYFGEVIEQDGSIHMWFGGVKTCLHLAIDKATSTIVGAWFDKQATLNGYYHVFYQILTKYGIPYKFFTDNRTIFNYMSLNPDKRTSDKDVLPQYGYAGIELETSSSKKINYTLTVLTPRKIDKGNSIKYKNKYYQPYLNNQLKCFIPKTACLVIKAFNGDLMKLLKKRKEKIYSSDDSSLEIKFFFKTN